ncbi:MAG: hypothetical protein PHP54_02670 [Clostridia bacterium]|nr:hypothetical protein [Clostridia bacterium]
MKKEIQEDERILIQKQKILGEACILLMVTLIVSMLVQRYVFNASFKQYVAEFICFLVVSIYILIRNLMLGINLFGEGKKTMKTTIVYSIIAGALVTIMNGISNYVRYAEHYVDNLGLFATTLLITFISATLLTFIVLLLFAAFNYKKQQEIEKKLDDEEKDD